MSLADVHPTYLTLREAGDIAIATVKLPQLTEEENIEQLGRELFALVEQYGCRKVVLNLESVQYTTSSVLGKMISLHRKLHRGNGRLVVARLQEPVLDVMRTSRLIDYFNVAPDVDAAVAELSGPAPAAEV